MKKQHWDACCILVQYYPSDSAVCHHFCTTMLPSLLFVFYTCFYHFLEISSIKSTSAVIAAEGCGHYADSEIREKHCFLEVPQGLVPLYQS